MEGQGDKAVASHCFLYRPSLYTYTSIYGQILTKNIAFARMFAVAYSIEYCINHQTPLFIGPQCLVYLQLTARARRRKFVRSGTSPCTPDRDGSPQIQEQTSACAKLKWAESLCKIPAVCAQLYQQSRVFSGHDV